MAWLGRLRVSELLERARSLGAHEHVLDELLDTEQPQAELIELILERMAQPPVDRVGGHLEAELATLTVKELRARATAAGVVDVALEQARDALDPRVAIINLILARSNLSSPTP